MDNNVRTGLGLFGTAAIAVVIALAIGQLNSGEGFLGEWLMPIAFVLCFVAAFGALIGGLVMVTWGLLRHRT